MTARLVDQPSAMPTRKVTAATVGAAASYVAADVIVGLLPESMFVDPDQLGFVIVGLGTLIAGYYIRERSV